MNKRTKALQFDQKTRQKIYARDCGCIFCKIGYQMPPEPHRDYQIMHIVNRSQGGLGVEQNGVMGCQYHHIMYDNDNKGRGAEMDEIIREYMMQMYPGWTKEDLVYRKYGKEFL